MKKRIISFTLAFILLLSIVITAAFAASGAVSIRMKLNDPYMTVNGQRQEVDPGRGTSPITINDRTMIPIRAVVEAMGGSIGWEDATQKITITANNHELTMWLGKTELVVDGINKTMDVAPQSVNDRTLVPVRFAAENVGYGVEWLEATSEVIITSDTNSASETISPQITQPSETTELTDNKEQEQSSITASTKPSIIDSPIIGQWNSNTSATDYYFVNTGEFAQTSSSGDGYEFRADGTYHYGFVSLNSTLFGTFGYYEEGRYRIDGNRIFLYEILCSQIAAVGSENKTHQFSNEPGDDETFIFKIDLYKNDLYDNDLTRLVMTRENDDFDLWYYKMD